MGSVVTTPAVELQNYVNGGWRRSATAEYADVTNPATAEVLARTPLSTNADVDGAVQAAADAFPAWRRTPPGERIQYLFKLKNLLEEHVDEIARLTTQENGKTFGEAKAELRRGIENVEVACGIPMMMQGYNLEDVTPGVDETLIRQPLGVVAAITPFNFPAMIPFWFLPYAIACGNTLVLKPSERVPLTMRRAVELIEKTGLPKGVVNLVNGGQTRLRAFGYERKAHAMPGRREESRHRLARCGHGFGQADHQRQRVRLRGAAMPRRFRRGDDRGSAKDFP
jgi:malonate-semialdehyde dehydrogenase (acetylating)/methylmalonate-semialdehyde dehydrogenase